MNRDTETLWYNTRMLIDSKIYGKDSEPRAWLISKVNRISPNGICRVTLTQDTYNQHTDYIEHDKSENIIGMWADYYRSSIEPTPIMPDEQSDIVVAISCSGKHQLKIGGSSKTLVVTFYTADGKVADYQPGEWSYLVDNEDITSLLTITPISDDKIKIIFNGDDNYINKILTVTFTSGDISASLDLEILPL